MVVRQRWAQAGNPSRRPLMGGFLLDGAILLLGLFVLFVWVMVDRGSGSSQTLREVPVADLAADPQRYVGQRISTEGQLQRLVGPGHRYEIRGDGRSVAIQGQHLGELQRLEGKGVKVVGRFGLGPGKGPYIEAEMIIPLQ